MVAPGKIRVSDISSEVVEELDFSGTRVIEMSLGFGHLVAATHNQVSAGFRARWGERIVASRPRSKERSRHSCSYRLSDSLCWVLLPVLRRP